MAGDDEQTAIAGTQTTAGETGRLMRQATYASVGVATTLVAAKLGAWAVTGSVALLSTLIDSLLDGAASLLTLAAVRQSLIPADEEHRFGHGKAEPLAGLGQSAFIGGSAFFLLLEATDRLMSPQPVTQGAVGIAVMVFSILMTLGLVAFQRHVVRKTGSTAINADSLHYAGDLLINGSVIVSLVIGMAGGWAGIDPLFAIGIAGYLLFNAWGIGRDAVNLLMDRELPEEERERIRAICLEHPGVHDVHDVRTRSTGRQVFIQLHLELDGAWTLSAAHAAAVSVEKALRDAYPGGDVIIHQDPAGVREDYHPEFAFEPTNPESPPSPARDET